MHVILRNRLFMAASLGHMILDIFNSASPVLVAFLSLSLGLSNADVAIALGLYQFMGAFSQPMFGWLADRYPARWMMGVSVAWTIGFLTLSIFAAQSGTYWLFLLPFVVASLGSGAFHPMGTKFAAVNVARRAATATALFFLFGQFGLAIGPYLTGLVLENIGLMGMPVVALFAVPIILFVLMTPLPSQEISSKTDEVGSVSDKQSSAQEAQATNISGLPWGNLLVLTFHTICRSWAQIGVIAFIPKLFQDKGWSPSDYGAIVSLMWIASAITGVLAGDAADRWGRRKVVFGVMILSVIPLYLLPMTETRFAYTLALLVGGLTGAPHSIIVVIAQNMLPGKQATASGLILGLMFGMGALATFAIGWLADIWTLQITLQASAIMGLLAAISALLLPGTRAAEAPRLEIEAATAQDKKRRMVI